MTDQAHQAKQATESLRDTISTIRPLSTLSRDGLMLIALEHGRLQLPAYVTFAEASVGGLVEVRELSGGDAVGAVEAVTRDRPVVIFAGDTIVGGKQNRIVNISIWLPPKSVTPIPVTCLEHGRWDSGRVFAAGRMADYALRAMVNRTVADHSAAQPVGSGDTPRGRAFAFAADQGGIWDEISAREGRIGRRSPTAALHDVYEQDAAAASDFIRAFPCPTGTTGVAVGVGGRVVAMEFFDTSETLALQWPRIVESAVSAHLDHQRSVETGAAKPPLNRYPDDGALGRMIARALRSVGDATVRPSIGDGTDVRLQGPRVAGAALLHDQRAVHVELFRVERS